jgi:hypothetical protein
MATGIIICLGGFVYVRWFQPAPVAAVLPAESVAPSPSATSSPTASPVPTPTPAPSRAVVSRVIKAFSPAHDGLITNEYALFNPEDHAAVHSADWEMTSGSLYGRGGSFWTGQPDECEPNAKSSSCTNSAVFRLDSKATFSGNIRVSLALMQLGEIHNTSCNQNDTCWHGTHVWLRYQNEYNLYYASVNRADGQVVIKRKVPCGNDNDGTYFVLGSYVPHDFHANQWSRYDVTVQTNFDRSVTIKLYDTDVSRTVPVTTGTDRGGINPHWSATCNTPGRYNSSRYNPITSAGGIGIRGDYASFMFRDLTVSRL